MRTIGHQVDVDRLRDDYDYYRSELDESSSARAKEKRGRNADHFLAHVTTAFDVARIGYLCDASLDEIVNTLRVALPELVVALELGAILDAIKMREYLGAALVVGAKPPIKWLAQLPKSSYTDPELMLSEAAYVLIQTVQAGMTRDEKAFRNLATTFRAELTPKRLVVDPASEKAVYEPLAALLQAVVDDDQRSLDAAWVLQAKAWKKRFGRASERANMEGILDFETLGIGRLAEMRGLRVPDTSLYAPPELLAAGESL